MANSPFYTSGDARLWAIPKRAGCGRLPQYMGCFSVSDLVEPLGDIVPFFCPDRCTPGLLEEVGYIRQQAGPKTATLRGLLARNLKDTFTKAKEDGCAMDLQVLLGQCNNVNTYLPYEADAIVFLDNVQMIGDFSISGMSHVNEAPEPIVVSVTIQFEDVGWRTRMAYNTKPSNASPLYPLLGCSICDSANCEDNCRCSDCGHMYVLQGNRELIVLPDTDGNIFISRDGGQTLERRVTGTGDSLRGIGSSSSGTYLAVGANNRMYVSQDYGETWTQQAPLPAPETATSLLTSAAVTESGNQIVVTNTGTIWLRPLGLGWVNVLTVAGVEFQRVRVSPNGTILAVGGDINPARQSIYRSTDAGVTWAEMTVPQLATTGTRIQNVQTDGNGVWVATAGNAGIYRSTDDGVTWTLIPGANANHPTIAPRLPAGFYWAVDTNRNGTWIAICGSTCAIRSDDNGVTWGPALAPPSGGADLVYRAGRWYAPGLNGRFSVSNTNGITWQDAGQIPSQRQIWTMLFDPPREPARLHESLDGGITFKPIDICREVVTPTTRTRENILIPEGQVVCFNGCVLVISLEIYYTRIRDACLQACGIGECDWQTVSSGLGPGQNLSGATAAVECNGILFITDNAGRIWRLRDCAMAPERVYNPSGPTVPILKIGSAQTGRLAAVGRQGKIVVGTVHDSWFELSSPTTNDLFAVHARDNREILIGGVDGLFCTTDCGQSWSKIRHPFDNMLTGRGVTAIHFHSRAIGYMSLQYGTSTPGQTRNALLVTTDGGNQWFVAPETGGCIEPGRIDSVCTCNHDKVFFVGMAGTQGSMVLAEGL